MASWTEYAALVRRLDQLSRARDEDAAGLAQRHEALGATVDQLDRRLAAQQQRLAQLGRAIGQHVGSRPAASSGVADPAEALRLARGRADAGDLAATEAEQLARRAPLLPGLSPLARNLVVYLACAFAAVALQYALLALSDAGRIGTLSLLALMCAGLPAAAFVAGYLVISAWGRPRLAPGPQARHPMLGAAICFLAMPAVYCGYKLALSLA